MENDIEPFLLKIFFFIVFLILSAFFSGAETAYFSLSKIKLQHLKESGIRRALRVAKLLDQPKQLLITILIGNTTVNVAAATVAALLTTDLCAQFQINEKLALFLEISVVVCVLLLVGEITPKIIAVKNAVSFSQQISFALQIISYVLYPFTFILAGFTNFISKIFSISDIGVFLSQEELKTLIDVGEEKGAIEEEEKEMIHSIFQFAHTSVREIMVPRIDMICVDSDMPLDELIGLIKSRGFTRIPLYEDRVDNIQGIIHAKDLLPSIKLEEDSLKTISQDLVKIARPVHYVPENKKIDDLLREFQSERIHMAIVVDEYGGTAGLITLEDVIEEIVGEIQDEYDTERPLFRKVNEVTFLVDGKINIHELQEEVLKMPIPISEGYDTLAGLIFDHTGYVPKENEKITYDRFDFIIEKIVKNRIVLVRIIVKDNFETDTHSLAE